MKIVNEIRSMTLLDAQKMVVDLRLNVQKTDRNYPDALQAINIVTGRKDWREPVMIEVKNVAGHDLQVDNVKIPKDGTGKLYHWQYVAVLRFVEPVNEADHQAAIDTCIRKPIAGENPVRKENLSRKSFI